MSDELARLLQRNRLDDAPQKSYDFDSDPQQMLRYLAFMAQIQRMAPGYSPGEGRLAEIGQDRRNDPPMGHLDQIKGDWSSVWRNFSNHMNGKRPAIDWSQGPLPGPGSGMPYFPTKP